MPDEITGTPEEIAAAEATAAAEKVAAETKAAEEKTAAETKAAEEKTAAETKAAEEKASADKKSKDGKTDDDKIGAPDAYEDFTLPDGVKKNVEVMGKFADIARGLKLNQTQAQGLVDLQTQFMLDEAKASQDEWEGTQDKWEKDARDDKEIGGEKFDENIAVMKSALDTFGNKELKTALDTTGTGNHPEFLRFLFRVGTAIGEDAIRLSKAYGKGQRTQAKTLFPDQN